MTNLILPSLTILVLFRTFNSIKSCCFFFFMSLLVRKPVLTMPSDPPIHKPETTKSQVGLDRSVRLGCPSNPG